MSLTILCVTRVEPCVIGLLRRMYYNSQTIGCEFAIAYDGIESFKIGHLANIPSTRSIMVQSAGYIETVLDEAVESCRTNYILRLDDDESMSSQMVEWLRSMEYESAPHWKFSRAHLFRDDETCIVNPPLWPDHQTRLSTRAMSFGRTLIHCGSPFGGGKLAPDGVSIIHHKFLVKSLEQRQSIVERYDSVSPGSGTCFEAFSLPEKVYLVEDMNLVTLSEVIS